MASPAVAVRDELVLSSGQRVVWMRNPEGFTVPAALAVVDRVLQRAKRTNLSAVARDSRTFEGLLETKALQRG